MVMCRKEMLITEVGFLAMVQATTSFVALVLGAKVAGDWLVEAGLGPAPRRVGRLVAILMFTTMCTTACGRFGARAHNKFCLLLFAAAQLSISILLLGVLATSVASLQSDVDVDLQLQCAVDAASAPECADLLRDESRERLRSLWDQLTGMAVGMEGRGYRMLLEDVQTSGSCCGFEPPFSCGGDRQCGAGAGWFVALSNCDELVQFANGTQWRPGCRFSQPAGQCIAFKYDRGCFVELRTYLLARSVPLLEACRGLVWANILAGAFAIFLLVKRKDHDVLPTAYIKRLRPQQGELTF